MIINQGRTHCRLKLQWTILNGGSSKWHGELQFFLNLKNGNFKTQKSSDISVTVQKNCKAHLCLCGRPVMVYNQRPKGMGKDKDLMLVSPAFVELSPCWVLFRRQLVFPSSFNLSLPVGGQVNVPDNREFDLEMQDEPTLSQLVETGHSSLLKHQCVI